MPPHKTTFCGQWIISIKWMSDFADFGAWPTHLSTGMSYMAWCMTPTLIYWYVIYGLVHDSHTYLPVCHIYGLVHDPHTYLLVCHIWLGAWPPHLSTGMSYMAWCMTPTLIYWYVIYGLVHDPHTYLLVCHIYGLVHDPHTYLLVCHIWLGAWRPHLSTGMSYMAWCMTPHLSTGMSYMAWCMTPTLIYRYVIHGYSGFIS